MYVRYTENQNNEEPVVFEETTQISACHKKKKEKSKLQLIAGLICVLYGADYINEKGWFEGHTDYLILTFFGLIVFNYIIGKLQKWISE